MRLVKYGRVMDSSDQDRNWLYNADGSRRVWQKQHAAPGKWIKLPTNPDSSGIQVRVVRSCATFCT